jgi:hypothetical protein
VASGGSRPDCRSRRPEGDVCRRGEKVDSESVRKHEPVLGARRPAEVLAEVFRSAGRGLVVAGSSVVIRFYG